MRQTLDEVSVEYNDRKVANINNQYKYIRSNVNQMFITLSVERCALWKIIILFVNSMNNLTRFVKSILSSRTYKRLL